jgi:hypothetical protein
LATASVADGTSSTLCRLAGKSLKRDIRHHLGYRPGRQGVDHNAPEKTYSLKDKSGEIFFQPTNSLLIKGFDSPPQIISNSAGEPYPQDV